MSFIDILNEAISALPGDHNHCFSPDPVVEVHVLQHKPSPPLAWGCEERGDFKRNGNSVAPSVPIP
mgnify:CR=1 FL=1